VTLWFCDPVVLPSPARLARHGLLLETSVGGGRPSHGRGSLRVFGYRIFGYPVHEAGSVSPRSTPLTAGVTASLGSAQAQRRGVSGEGEEEEGGRSQAGGKSETDCCRCV